MTMTVAPPPALSVPETETPEWEPSPTPPRTPPPTPPPRRAPAGIVGGLILIALGLVFLGINFFAAPGALLFLGLGAAFLIARNVTGQYGFSVPAGILLGFGTFVGLSEYGVLNGQDAGGAFFVLLGLGFLAVYVIGGRPTIMWPILPSVALIGFGLFVQTVMFGWPLQGYAWLADYWPLAVVAVGVWLLARDYLPPAARMPVAIVGASILVLIGLLVAAAGVASVVNPVMRTADPVVPWSAMRPLSVFGSPPLQDTLRLSAPLGTAQSITVANTSGRTLVAADLDRT